MAEEFIEIVDLDLIATSDRKVVSILRLRLWNDRFAIQETVSGQIQLRVRLLSEQRNEIGPVTLQILLTDGAALDLPIDNQCSCLRRRDDERGTR